MVLYRDSENFCDSRVWLQVAGAPLLLSLRMPAAPLPLPPQNGYSKISVKSRKTNFKNKYT